jgi:hypothetical protein
LVGPMNLLKRISQRIKGIQAAADAGMTTAEYAVGTVAAVAFAAILYKVVRSPAVQDALSSIPVLILLLAVGLAAIDVGRVRIRCVDAAREGALAAARGDDAAGRVAALMLAPGATVSITRSEDYVTVQVEAVAALRGLMPDRSVRASSTALIEPTGLSP